MANELELSILINKKIIFFKEIFQKTLIHINTLKTVNIINFQESLKCIATLSNILATINDVKVNANRTSFSNVEVEPIISTLQSVNNDISSFFKIYGTQLLEDLLWICFGNNSINMRFLSPDERQEFEILLKHFHPTGYSVISPKDSKKITKIFEIENCVNSSNFYTNVHGIRVTVFNQKFNKENER